LPRGEGSSFGLNNVGTLLNDARRAFGLLRSPLLMPLMLSGDTDQYSNVGFIGPAYQKAADSLGALNNASTATLQNMGLNTQADYQTARSDVLDELARLNYSASEIAAVQRGGAPLLKAGWSNASKFVGSVDNGPRIEVYPADISGNGPQMTVYPADSPHPSEYFITTPIIQGGKMALGTTYPALPPRGWKEFILTSPADSGLPPQHVMYSEGQGLSLSDLDKKLGVVEKQLVYNSAGQPVIRGWVGTMDDLLAIAEHRAGGSLDNLIVRKPDYWRAPDDSMEIEWTLSGHASPVEGPHVKIMYPDETGKMKVSEKYFVKGMDRYLKPTKF
jgi:S-type Pyocin